MMKKFQIFLFKYFYNLDKDEYPKDTCSLYWHVIMAIILLPLLPFMVFAKFAFAVFDYIFTVFDCLLRKIIKEEIVIYITYFFLLFGSFIFSIYNFFMVDPKDLSMIEMILIFIITCSSFVIVFLLIANMIFRFIINPLIKFLATTKLGVYLSHKKQKTCQKIEW